MQILEKRYTVPGDRSSRPAEGKTIMELLGYLQLTANDKKIQGYSTEVKHPKWLRVLFFTYSVDTDRSSASEAGIDRGKGAYHRLWFRLPVSPAFPELMQTAIGGSPCEGRFEVVKKGLVVWSMDLESAILGPIRHVPAGASGKSDSFDMEMTAKCRFKASAEMAAKHAWKPAK